MSVSTGGWVVGTVSRSSRAPQVSGAMAAEPDPAEHRVANFVQAEELSEFLVLRGSPVVATGC